MTNYNAFARTFCLSPIPAVLAFSSSVTFAPRYWILHCNQLANRKSPLNKILKARSSRETAAVISDGAARVASRIVELMTAAIANALAALQKAESSRDSRAEFCDRPQIPELVRECSGGG